MHKAYNFIKFCIALVWFANGLFCKILKLAPRHEEIVGRILGAEFASTITVLIGISEVIMAIWIVSGYKARLNAITQIAIVATMNILEFVLAPDLLLWGKFNLIFAFLFILVVYFNEFHFKEKRNLTH